MSDSIQRSQLADELHQIYRSAPDHADPAIEAHLQARLGGLPMRKRTVLLKQLVADFGGSQDPARAEGQTEEEILTQVFTLLLGQHVAHLNLPATELLERLAASLNTVFDSLNRLIGAIQSTLMGGSDPDKTIRHVIGNHLDVEGVDRLKFLENHIGQIGRAFLLTQQAFKRAAERTVCKLLQELDPATISKDSSKGLRFGPLRKAEWFETYEQKFQQCHKWFESGRFMEDLMREFERACEGESKTTF